MCRIRDSFPFFSPEFFKNIWQKLPALTILGMPEIGQHSGICYLHTIKGRKKLNADIESRKTGFFLLNICNILYPGKYKFTFSVRLANPLLGCCVLMSKTWNFDSNVVAASLFILMSLRSNSRQQTW